jgi:alkylation response protein AidB-like acyl-CoA dehydrogenase
LWGYTNGSLERRTDNDPRRREVVGTGKSPVTAFRKLRDNGTTPTASIATRGEMAEMGWAGILIPEEFGSTGLGYLTFGWCSKKPAGP